MQVRVWVNLIRKGARPACPQGASPTVSPQTPLLDSRGGQKCPSLSQGSHTQTESLNSLRPAWGGCGSLHPPPDTGDQHITREASPETPSQWLPQKHGEASWRIHSLLSPHRAARRTQGKPNNPASWNLKRHKISNSRIRVYVNSKLHTRKSYQKQRDQVCVHKSPRKPGDTPTGSRRGRGFLKFSRPHAPRERYLQGVSEDGIP